MQVQGIDRKRKQLRISSGALQQQQQREVVQPIPLEDTLANGTNPSKRPTLKRPEHNVRQGKLSVSQSSDTLPTTAAANDEKRRRQVVNQVTAIGKASHITDVTNLARQQSAITKELTVQREPIHDHDTRTPDRDVTNASAEDDNGTAPLDLSQQLVVPLSGIMINSRDFCWNSRNIASHVMNPFRRPDLLAMWTRTAANVPSIIPAWLCFRDGDAGYWPPITAMAWDTLGVLLAVAGQDGVVRVFDWDELVAADLRGRNAYLRGNTNAPLALRPVLRARLVDPNDPITLLSWNPFQPDMLAVGTKSRGSILLYDMAEVAAQPATASPIHVLAAGNKSFRCPFKTVLFLDKGNHVIASFEEVLVCWCITGTAPVVKWRMSWKPTSCVTEVSCDLVVAGSSNGCLLLIKWKETERPAFSRICCPHIVNQWVSYRTVDNPPPVLAMGIRHIHIEKGKISQDGTEGRFRLFWVTSGGWMLSALIDSSGKRVLSTEIEYATAPVKCVDTTMNRVKPSKQQWSLPADKVQVACSRTTRAVVWEAVPRATLVLAHGDNRVVGTESHVMPSNTKPKLLLFVPPNRPQLIKVALAKAKGGPTSLALHPSHEWIAVGTSSCGIYAANLRKQSRDEERES